MAAVMDVADVRTDMKLQRFDGTDEKWGDWSLRFEAYTARLGMENCMVEAELQAEPALNGALGERALVVSTRLWHLLITLCEGKALGITRLARKNGLEAWRQLKIECENKSGNR